MTDIPVGLMAPIEDMAQFEIRARQIQEYMHGCATVVSHWARSIVGESPVIRECATTADTIASVLQTLAPQVGEVMVITRTAQPEYWKLVDDPGVHDGKWIPKKRA